MSKTESKLKRQANLALAEDRQESKDLVQELINFRRMHGGLLILTIFLVAFGLVMMFSISLSPALIRSSLDRAPTALYFFKKQLFFSVIGVLAMIGVGTIVHVRKFNKWIFAGLAYGGTTLLLIANKLMGTTLDGAQRWFYIGPVSIQVSEIAKLAAVFVLAFYFSHLRALRSKGQLKFSPKWQKYSLFLHAFVDFTLPVLAMGIWLFLILIQPHLSGAIIFTLIVFSCFLVAKIPLRSWLVGGLQCFVLLLVFAILVSFLMPVIAKQSLSDFVAQRFAHVSRRLATHDSPESASADELYHVRQARLAIGSGGISGVGFGQGRQKFNYLPMGYNDYIFPALGEELGFVGTTSVLLAFLLFMWFGLNITMKANSLFALIVAWGYTMLITIQALLHMLVTLGVMPATGISLPFFSYGGSSNMLFLVAVGLILSVSKTAQRSPKDLRVALSDGQSRRQRESARENSVGPIQSYYQQIRQRQAQRSVSRQRQRRKGAQRAQERTRRTLPDYPQIVSEASREGGLSARGFQNTKRYLAEQRRHSS